MITSFDGSRRFLSNFYPATVMLDGELYPTIEHAYQAAKTMSQDERWQIIVAQTPGEAKRMGRRVTLRPDWDKVKLEIMEDLVIQKFTRSRLLEKWLLETGDQELIEGNAWGDRFWGQSPVGVGQNHLGRILMKVRDSLRGALRA